MPACQWTPIEIAAFGAAWRPRWLAMSSQSSTVHAPPRLLEHPPKNLKPAALLGLALSQNVQSGCPLAQVDSVLKYLATALQVADMFTKQIFPKHFERLRRVMMGHENFDDMCERYQDAKAAGDNVDDPKLYTVKPVRPPNG